VARTLGAWRERFPKAAGDSRVFVDGQGEPLEVKKLFRQLRMDLKTAKVDRPELHDAGENWERSRSTSFRRGPSSGTESVATEWQPVPCTKNVSLDAGWMSRSASRIRSCLSRPD
jgi:hypothetical protein